MSKETHSAAGIVSYINPREVKTGKDKGKTAYSFALQNQEGWYGTYLQEPPAVGLYVEFDYTISAAGFNQVKWDSLEVTEPEETEEEEKPKAKGKPATGAAKAYASAGNRSANINWQSARASAIAVAQVGATAGILDLGAGKKDSKLEALLIYVNRMTLDFYGKAMEVEETGELPADFQE